MSNLYRFMKDRETPIERIPHLGFKQSEFILSHTTLHHLGPGFQTWVQGPSGELQSVLRAPQKNKSQQKL